MLIKTYLATIKTDNAYANFFFNFEKNPVFYRQGIPSAYL